MKKLTAAGWFVIMAFTVQAQNIPLRVLSYNINFGQVATIEQLAGFIKGEQIDLAALQELDYKTYRSSAKHQNGIDMLTSLAYYTELMPVFGKSIDFSGGLYGIGILSRYSFLQTEKFMLPFPEGAKEQRILLMSKVLLLSNDTIVFACVHLDHSISSVRQAQVKEVLGILEEACKKYPVILAGDFNAEPSSDEIRLMNGWLRGDNENYTFSTDQPHIKIDYVFLYPKERWKINSHSVLDNVKLSDHLPVLLDVELINK